MEIEIKRHNFVTTVYEIPSEFNSKSTIDFIKKFSFTDSEMLTTFFDSPEILKDERLVDLKNHVYKYITIFVEQIMKQKKFDVKGSWLQAYRKNDFHEMHIHNCKINDYSLIFYIQCTKDSSRTVFSTPGAPYVTAPTVPIEAEKSKFVIFPGSVPHYVTPNQDEERIVLSCNFSIE